jgi:glutaconate CoA-transferase, subunit B
MHRKFKEDWINFRRLLEMKAEYSNLEMMVIAASRLLANNELVLVGTGVPLVAASLAKKTHARGMKVLMEAVAYDCDPESLPFCVADPRAVYNTKWTPTSVEVMGQFLQRGKINKGFLGGAQVDKYGNLNSTCIGAYNQPSKRFEGSGGASDIALMAKNTIIIMAHEKKRFVDSVDFITSPGWYCRHMDGKSLAMRAEMGLEGGPLAVVSTMGVMKFDDSSKIMYVDRYYEELGVDPYAIQKETGFEIDVSRASPIAPPSREELHILRNRVDPEGIYMKY